MSVKVWYQWIKLTIKKGKLSWENSGSLLVGTKKTTKAISNSPVIPNFQTVTSRIRSGTMRWPSENVQWGTPARPSDRSVVTIMKLKCGKVVAWNKGCRIFVYGLKLKCTNKKENYKMVDFNINLNFTWRSSPYRAVNTLRLGYKNQ